MKEILMKNIKNSNEYKNYSINRILYNQKIELDLLSYQLEKKELYDINDNYNLIQEIISMNLVLQYKLQHEKRK